MARCLGEIRRFLRIWPVSDLHREWSRQASHSSVRDMGAPAPPRHECRGYEQRPLKRALSRIHPAPFLALAFMPGRIGDFRDTLQTLQGVAELEPGGRQTPSPGREPWERQPQMDTALPRAPECHPWQGSRERVGIVPRARALGYESAALRAHDGRLPSAPTAAISASVLAISPSSSAGCGSARADFRCCRAWERSPRRSWIVASMQ